MVKIRRNTITQFFKKLSRGKPASSDADKARTTQDGHCTPVVNDLDDPNCAVMPGLFRLAVELQMQILSHLSFSDLRSLRLTCQHADKNILASSDILHQWLKKSNYISKLQLRLYPPPAALTFTYLLEQFRRLRVANSFACVLYDFVMSDFLYHIGSVGSRPSHDHYAHRCIFNSHEQELESFVLVLQHYLERLAGIWLALPTTSIPAPKSFTEVFDIHEREIYTHYLPTEIDRADKVWSAIEYIFTCVRGARSFSGAVDRNILASKGSADLRSEDVRSFIIFTNIRGIRDVLLEKRKSERSMIVNTAIQSLDPERNVGKWEESWRAISYRLHDEGPTELQVEAALMMNKDYNAIWTKFARQILAQNRMTLDEMGSDETESDIISRGWTHYI